MVIFLIGAHFTNVRLCAAYRHAPTWKASNQVSGGYSRRVPRAHRVVEKSCGGEKGHRRG